MSSPQSFSATAAVLLATIAMLFGLLSTIATPSATAMPAAPEERLDFSDTKVRAGVKAVSAGDTIKVRYKNLPEETGKLGILLCPNVPRQTTTGCSIAHEVRAKGRTDVKTSFAIDSVIDEGFGVTDCAAIAKACFLMFLHVGGGLYAKKNLTFEGAQPRVRVKTQGLTPGQTLKLGMRHLSPEVNRVGVLLCPAGLDVTTGCAVIHEVRNVEGRRVKSSFTIPGSIDEGFGVTDCTAEADACFLWFLSNMGGELDVKKSLTFS